MKNLPQSARPRNARRERSVEAGGKGALAQHDEWEMFEESAPDHREQWRKK